MSSTPELELRDFARTLRTIAEPHAQVTKPGLGAEIWLRTPFARWRGVRDAGPDLAIGPDHDLWRAMLDPAIDVPAILGRYGRMVRTGVDSGSLFPQEAVGAIEVWTEVELAGLHAVDRLAEARRDPTLAAMVQRVAHWHVENIQPDNATNRPWAIHVFARAAAAGDVDARLYTQTLLHNCQTALGTPDRYSAHILLDAAERLERAG